MPITDAQAEAVTELAKTGGRAIDAGAFIAKTVGTVPEDLIGLAGGDWLHEQRRRNIAHTDEDRAHIGGDRVPADFRPKSLTSPATSRGRSQ